MAGQLNSNCVLNLKFHVALEEKRRSCDLRFFLVCRACPTARRCKSSSQRDGREVIAKRKGEITLAARRGLKEARRCAGINRRGVANERVVR